MNVTDTFTIDLRTLVLSNALLETLSCVYSEIMFAINSFSQKLIKGGWNKSGGGELENFSKIKKREGTIIRYSRVNKTHEKLN